MLAGHHVPLRYFRGSTATDAADEAGGDVYGCEGMCEVVLVVEEVEGCADEVLEALGFWSGDRRLGKGNRWDSGARRRAQTQQRSGEGRSH